MQQPTTRHVRRWQLHRGKVGYGHVAERLAGGLSEGLVQARGRTAHPGRVGGDWSLRGPRPTLRRRAVDPPNGGTAGTGINAASSPPAEKGRAAFDRDMAAWLCRR